MSSYRKPWHQKPYRRIRGLNWSKATVEQHGPRVCVIVKNPSLPARAHIWLTAEGAHDLAEALKLAYVAAHTHRAHKQHIRAQKKAVKQ